MSKLEISTYDFLSVVSLELQISPPTVNSLTRIVWDLFPERLEVIGKDFIPNLWINRIIIQLPDDNYGIIDADLWHDVYYYLVNFSGVDKSFYTYTKDKTFEDWFVTTVDNTPKIEIDVSKSIYEVPKEITKEYININNRLLVSLYVLDAFGTAPKDIMRKKLVSNEVVQPPK